MVHGSPFSGAVTFQVPTATSDLVSAAGHAEGWPRLVIPSRPAMKRINKHEVTRRNRFILFSPFCRLREDALRVKMTLLRESAGYQEPVTLSGPSDPTNA